MVEQIRDRTGAMIGQLLSNSDQTQLLNRSGAVVAIYRPASNMTTLVNGRLVGAGNQLGVVLGMNL